MWSSRFSGDNSGSLRRVERYGAAGALGMALLLALGGCTVQPLNAARPAPSIANGSGQSSVSDILARTEVAAVNNRVAQQVRNRLLFAMNGGRALPDGRYSVQLTVSHVTQLLSIQRSSLAPTSAQVRVTAGYSLVDKSSGSLVAKGTRIALAAYDRTPQSFSNLRAQRDAQNRAAHEVAEQLRLAIAQDIAKL